VKKWQFLNVAIAGLQKRENVNLRNVQNVDRKEQCKKYHKNGGLNDGRK
jgi:hypothetical protein